MSRINDDLNWDDIEPENMARQFDYQAWTNPALKTEAKLCRVLWDSDYADLVRWKTVEERDLYFARDFGDDQLVLTEATGPNWNHTNLTLWHEGDGKYAGSIRVDLPMESVTSFNYLSVDKYPQPVPGPEERETKFFFFIRAAKSLSPNATELFLSLDVWTTYFHRIELQGLTLTQGHYPVSQASATEFLLNPVATAVDLTADEPDLPSVKNMVKHAELVSLTSEEPRVCIATTADLAEQGRFWFPSNDNQPPQFWWNDTTDFGWEGTAPVPAAGTSFVNGEGPGLRVYSIAPEDYNAFISYCRDSLPQLILTIEAIYVLPKMLITEVNGPTIGGFNLKGVRRQTTPTKIAELGINKELFGYEPENAEFAKLYTEQFAEIQISDNQGGVAKVTVESLAGNLDVYARAATAFPFLKLEAFIDGIGGRGAKNYTIAPWESRTATIFNSKFEDFSFELDVPTYAVYIDPRQESGLQASLENWLAAQRYDKEYDAKTRDINAAFATGDRSRATDYQNTSREIIAEYGNENDAILTDYNNTKRSIDTDFDTSQLTVNSSYGTTQDTILTAFENENRATNATFENDQRAIATKFDNTRYTLGVERDAQRGEVYTAHTVKSRDLLISQSRDANAYSLNYYLTGYEMVTTSNIAILNQWGADTAASFNYYQSTASNFLGVQGNAVSLASTAVGSTLSMAGGTPGLGLVAGLVSLQQSIGYAIQQIEISQDIVQLDYDVNTFSNYLNHSLRSYDELRYYQDNGGGPDSPINPFDGDGTQLLYTAWPDENDLVLQGNPLVELVYPTGEVKPWAKVKSVATAVREERYNSDEHMRDYILNNADSLRMGELEFYTLTYDYERDAALGRIGSFLGYEVNDGLTLGEGGVQNDVNIFTRNTEITNAAESKAVALTNSSATKTTSDATNLVEKTTGNTNNTAVRDTGTENAQALKLVRQATNDLMRGVDGVKRVNNADSSGPSGTVKTNLEEIRDKDRLNRDADLELAKAELKAARAMELTKKPNSYGTADGPGHIDQWGLRGLTVTVSTVGKAAEKIIGDYFRLKGYTMNSVLVKNPPLSVMDTWTFWKADRVWLSAGKINDANENIIREIFMRGVTVWDDPDSVKNISLPNGVKNDTQ